MDDLLLTNFRKNVESSLGKEEWISVIEFFNEGKEIDSGAYFSALIPDNQVERILEKYEWDLRIGYGRPGFCSTYESGEEKTEYYRYYKDGIEPLVYWRTFSGPTKSYVEISEEFRLFFDLFEQVNSDGSITFISINDDGEEDDVARVNGNNAKIKLRYIKDYLSARKMHLAIFFEAMRFLPQTIEELNIAATDEVIKKDKLTYSLCVRNMPLGKTSSQGWVLGKRLIQGSTTFKPEDFGSTEEKFQEFITGIDENGNAVQASCNTDHQKTPSFLTPIFFKREVLKKYYDNPDKYTVEDAYVKRDGFWGLRVLNNHSDHVVVWLGDLNKIPFKEQSHWKAFNITPSDRKISHSDFARNINGEFTDPEHPELYFKYKFNKFQSEWYEKYGWYLFKPLSAADQHHMKSLHVPTGTGQKEFDDQVGSITKILIDSLNERKISEGIVIDKENPKSIDKLEQFLVSKGRPVPQLITFLRNLQSLRSSSVAHRKGTKFNKVKDFFKIDKDPFPKVFEEILIHSIFTLNTLESIFI
ncbi:hypothetical protein KBC89_00265 [Candidatus Woesebacteria bacterium]|nr:hypothetical protein [Candidatus Woesebacteria bacterium]